MDFLPSKLQRTGNRGKWGCLRVIGCLYGMLARRKNRVSPNIPNQSLAGLAHSIRSLRARDIPDVLYSEWYGGRI